MARPYLKDLTQYQTLPQVAEILNMSEGRVLRRIVLKLFPPPTFIDKNGTRYFSQKWLDGEKK